VLGGQNKMVEVFELGDKKSIQQKIFEQPNMLMKF
jgi:hypothetical protein